MSRKTPYESERQEFAAFCQAATTAQLAEIIRKEAAGRRITYMQIAQEELARREA